jgi:rSAM/selenodomain-associated transferase 2
MNEAPFVSIIIPTLNEAENVSRQARSLCVFPEAEVIVVDGGSNDGTVRVAEQFALSSPNVRLVRSAKGRGRQMNAGARAAQGTWLIFLHADTELTLASYQAFVRFVTVQPETCGGAFTFRVAHHKVIYRYLEWYVAQRCRLLKMPFGDQALFARCDAFWELGGYREDFPLMEDMEFVERLNKRRGFKVVDYPVFTSARRFEAEGYLRRTLGNLYLQVLYKCGVHPERLAQMYYR